MENSGKLMFGAGDETPTWFVKQGAHTFGPLSTVEVCEQLQSKQLDWSSFVWNDADKSWKHLFEMENFKKFLPTAQSTSPPPAPQKKPAVVPTKRKVEAERVTKWFLYYSDSQFGPFVKEEVDRFLRVGKIHLGVFAWRDGLESWTRLSELDEFEGTESQETETVIESGSRVELEMRLQSRKPIVARILVASGESVIVGMCRDISLGGMQVLTDEIPGRLGEKIRINVTPTDPRISPFVTEGSIVRILEDGRGFSFRFKVLSDDAKRSIRTYIESEEQS